MNEKSNGFVTEIVNNENKLKEQIEKLQAQLDSAREVINFYNENCMVVIGEDFYPVTNLAVVPSGERARKWLEENK